MSMILSIDAPLQISILDAAKSWMARLPRAVRLLATVGLVLAASHQLSLALESPAQRITRQLTAAAAEVAALPWNHSSERVQRAVGWNFSSRAARVDATRFPTEVAVTLPGLDRDTCVEATAQARRIEGLVVVALEGYGSAQNCRDDNTMVWHIMP